MEASGAMSPGRRCRKPALEDKPALEEKDRAGGERVRRRLVDRLCCFGVPAAQNLPAACGPPSAVPFWQ